MPKITDKLIRHQIFLERFAGSVAKTIQNGVDRARDKTLASLLSDVNTLDVKQLQLDLEELLKAATGKALEELKELSKHEANFNVTLLKKELDGVVEATEVAILAALLNKAMPVGLAEKKANRKLEPALNQFSKNTARQMVLPVRDSQTTGSDIFTAAATITALTGGLFSAQARSIARSGAVHAANTSKEEVFKVNPIKQVEWVSVLDSHTTDYCRGQDGKLYDVGVGPRPPAHYNCRSVTQPVIEE